MTAMITVFDTSIATKNMGDAIIMDAVHRQLRKIFPNAFFATVPTHDAIGAEAYKLIAESDYTFVGGTNLLSSNLETYRQWKLSDHDIEKLKNVILMGVGWWQYQEQPNELTACAYRKIFHGDSYHSVRDQYTAQHLGTTGLENVLNTACPTMWDLDADHCAQVPSKQADHVVMTVTDYKRNAALDAELFNTLARRYDKVYLWLQGAGDYAYARGFVDADKVEFVAPSLAAYDDLLRRVDSLDYVGTRLHAGIRALQHKKRSLIIAVDNRAAEISRDCHLPVLERTQLTALGALIEQDRETRLRLPLHDIERWKRQFA